MLNKILVPLDGSENADRGFDLACDLALKYGAEICLLHVVHAVGDGPVPESQARFADLENMDVREAVWSMGSELLLAATNRAHGKGVGTVEQKLRVGDPAIEIGKQADDMKADAVIMGRRGLGTLKGLLVGSVSSKVMQLVTCTVVVVT